MFKNLILATLISGSFTTTTFDAPKYRQNDTNNQMQTTEISFNGDEHEFVQQQRVVDQNYIIENNKKTYTETREHASGKLTRFDITTQLYSMTWTHNGLPDIDYMPLIYYLSVTNIQIQSELDNIEMLSEVDEIYQLQYSLLDYEVIEDDKPIDIYTTRLVLDSQNQTARILIDANVGTYNQFYNLINSVKNYNGANYYRNATQEQKDLTRTTHGSGGFTYDSWDLTYWSETLIEDCDLEGDDGCYIITCVTSQIGELVESHNLYTNSYQDISFNDASYTIEYNYPIYINVNYEYINVPEVMFYIIGMPWTFVSGAFNLTLFSGTPYSVNIGNIITTILAVLTILMVIRIIMKIKG